MRYDERAKLLKDWAERLSDLVEVEMWDKLNNELVLSNKDTERQSTAGAYAKAVERIYWALQEQVEELEKLALQAEKEASIAEDAEKMFYAWELVLCPLAVSDHAGAMPIMGYYSALEEIASYRNEEGLSYDDTERAIEMWLSEKRRTA